jgi:hypothetical protein
MSTRARILSFGSAGILVLAGALCAVFVSGLTGQLLALVLLSIGLGGAVLLVFLEVGLSEDHARAREAARRESERANGSEHERGPRAADRTARPRHPARRRLIQTPRRPG